MRLEEHAEAVAHTYDAAFAKLEKEKSESAHASFHEKRLDAMDRIILEVFSLIIFP